MTLNHSEETIEERHLENLREYLDQQQPMDIADIIGQMSDSHEQKRLIALLSVEDAAVVINELADAELIAEILRGLPLVQAQAILNEMPSDDVADFIFALSDDEQTWILGLLEDTSASDVQSLLGYGEDTAGGLMTKEYVVVAEFLTAKNAIEIIRHVAPGAETVYYIYVVDGKNCLVGVLSLRELIVALPQTTVAEIMWGNVISVNVHEDQEDVARLVAKYNFLAVPVVDDEGHLEGIITVDDIIDVIHAEAAEDMYRLAGTNAAEEDDDETLSKFSTAFKSRMPWLLVTIVGGLLSGQVLNIFSDRLSEVVALSFFIPMLIGMGGNVGTQSSTVTVRGIATGSINTKTVLGTICREGSIGIALGLTIGSIVALAAYIWQGSIRLGIVVGIAMLVNMFAAATMGTLVPLLFQKINVDPAVASAPFITTTIDVMGLVIYATLATLLLGL